MQLSITATGTNVIVDKFRRAGAIFERILQPAVLGGYRYARRLSTLRSACTKGRRLSTLRPFLVVNASTAVGAERKNMTNLLAEQYAGVLAHLDREMSQAEQKLAGLQAEMIQVQADRNALLKLVAELEKRRDLAVLAQPLAVSGFIVRQSVAQENLGPSPISRCAGQFFSF